MITTVDLLLHLSMSHNFVFKKHVKSDVRKKGLFMFSQTHTQIVSKQFSQNWVLPSRLSENAIRQALLTWKRRGMNYAM